jgi:hypothetical protein
MWDPNSTKIYIYIYIYILLLISSKIQPDDDPMGSKHVAVWISHKVVFDGYLLIPYFIVQHNFNFNFKIKIAEKNVQGNGVNWKLNNGKTHYWEQYQDLRIGSSRKEVENTT